MKILVVSNLFPPRSLGGYEILCGQVCAALERRGHAVTVLTTDGGPDLPGEPPVADVRRDLRLAVPFGREARRDRVRDARVSAFNRLATRTAAAALRPDVAFVWSQLRLTLGSARGLEDARIPTLFTENDEHLAGFVPGPFAGPAGWARRALDQVLFRGLWLPSIRLDHVTCISRCVRDALAARGVPMSGATVIHQGIPVERFPPKDDPGSVHDPLRILYAGQLHPDKGVHVAIDAVGRLRAAGLPVRLTVAGDGPGDYPDTLRARAADCDAPVDFVGRLPHEALPAMYRDHDAFVFPSIWREPFGLTHLEAMASGTPVVSTADGGQGEFLEHGSNALVVPKADPSALAEALATLARDDDLRRRLAATAREMVTRRFSVDRYVDDLAVLLAKVAGGAP